MIAATSEDQRIGNEADASGPSLAATTMDFALTLNHILERAGTVHARSEIVTRRPDGNYFRYSYLDFYRRALKLADALRRLGLKRGDRVGSLLWNHYAHLEAYFGVPAAGGVLHTINLRLHPDEIAYTIKEADDRILIVEDTLLPLVENILGQFQNLQVFVFSLAGAAVAKYPNYNELIDSGSADAPMADVGERDPATLCFTGGTTGRPKGVVYSHRGLVLHAFAEAMVDGMGFARRDVVMPLVPMFHVNGWGIPFSATMVGVTQVYPGIRPSPQDVLELCESSKVTWSAGVPTVWSDVFDEMKRQPGRWSLDGLTVMTGGSAPTETLIRNARHNGVFMIQGWGLTESSGIAAVSRPNKRLLSESPEEQVRFLAKQGVPLPIVRIRNVRDGRLLPWDGFSQGEIQLRGTSVTARYLNRPDAGDRWTDDGFFRTGDIGTIDAEGYVKVLDRTEDLIKSGGEWISPLDLESVLLEHPAVRECALIAIPHERWGERPLAVVVLHEGSAAAREELLALLGSRFAKWQVPDDLKFVSEIPKTSVGKVSRVTLRQQFQPSKE